MVIAFLLLPAYATYAPLCRKKYLNNLQNLQINLQTKHIPTSWKRHFAILKLVAAAGPAPAYLHLTFY